MRFGPLIQAKTLREQLEGVRVVDVRWYADGRSGRDAYLAGHIPGAVWLDIDTDLAAPASAAAGRHPLPSQEEFATALGRVGIGAGSRVVAYDDAGGSVAARLWWLLHVLNEPVAVLDGGVAAWQAIGGELTSEIPELDQVTRPASAWPADRFVDADAVAGLIAAADGGAGAVVYDARTAERYAGAPSPLDPRPGHIPGARSAPWAGNLDDAGRFKQPAALRARFAAERPAIAYCGSGITACHDLLAMNVAGMAETALYAGSWSQWAANPSRPTE